MRQIRRGADSGWAGARRRRALQSISKAGFTTMERVELTRDCEGVQVPAGNKITLEKGVEVFITQSLGGTYTVQAQAYGGLFRIAGADADGARLRDGGDDCGRRQAQDTDDPGYLGGERRFGMGPAVESADDLAGR